MTQPRILVTRPEPAVTGAARRLEEAGFSVSIFPLLHIHLTEGAKETISQRLNAKTACIIATSQHALPLLASIAATHTLPLAVAGEASAALAHQLGFRQVIEGGGNAESMVSRITDSFSPTDGALLYVRGQDVSTDLAATLHAAGFTVAEAIVYEARTVTTLPEPLQEQIRRHEIHAITAYSRRSLHTLEMMIEKHGLAESASHITLACFSPAIAEAADKHLWKQVECADSSCEEAMRALFMRLYGTPPSITTVAGEDTQHDGSQT